MIKRHYDDKIKKLLKPNRVLVIYGPRRVGKTTLVDSYLSKLPVSTKVYRSTGENKDLQDVFEATSFSKILPFFESYDQVFIDEAQMIENIGLGLKVIVDQIPNIKVIATGSSSFDLSNKIGEPLVGRQHVLKLFPLSVMELVGEFGGAYPVENLDNLLVYGGYPDVIKSKSFKEKVDILTQIRDSYLYKDILELENIRNSKKIYDLLRLLAFQIGQEVSIQELGTQLGMSRALVERYLDLLEKSFVLINLRGYSRNLRKEVNKMSRYYFYDNGVRNAVIGNFSAVKERDDLGQLWENFLFIERLKKQAYGGQHSNNYFWRTWDQQEIDLVEERDGKLFGFEFKYSSTKARVPKTFVKTYPGSSFKLINRHNFLEFVM
jgi:uncharacterized protein